MRDEYLKEIATFAKYMVCPQVITESVANDTSLDLAALGLASFGNYRYRQLSDHYLGNSDAEPDVLLDVLIEEMAPRLRGREVILLLSDGKDSLTLALALSKLGISCNTLTLLRRKDDDLRDYIQKISADLGHVPYFVTVDDIIKSFDFDLYVSSFLSADKPVMDQGYLFFFLGLKIFFEKNSHLVDRAVVVDGLGNDETLGYLPSKMQYRSYIISLLNLWRIRPQKPEFLKWYIRSPAESHGMLSAISAFFPIRLSYDLNCFFSRLPQGCRDERYLDFRAFSRGSHHDHYCMMAKTRLSCDFLNVSSYFPWAEEKVANYCFNLPQKDKYDFKDGINKVILRELLENRLGWKQQKRGVDLYIDLNLVQFSIILRKNIPSLLIDRILESSFVSDDVKKRAILELLNFYSFCIAKGMSADAVSALLLGDNA